MDRTTTQHLTAGTRVWVHTTEGKNNTGSSVREQLNNKTPKLTAVTVGEIQLHTAAARKRQRDTYRVIDTNGNEISDTEYGASAGAFWYLAPAEEVVEVSTKVEGAKKVRKARKAAAAVGPDEMAKAARKAIRKAKAAPAQKLDKAPRANWSEDGTTDFRGVVEGLSAYVHEAANTDGTPEGWAWEISRDGQIVANGTAKNERQAKAWVAHTLKVTPAIWS